MPLGGTSTNKAGLDAISDALKILSDANGLSTITQLNNQLGALSKAFNMPDLPKLIDHLEKLGTITKQQADLLRSLNQGPGIFQQIGKGIRDYQSGMGMVGQGLSGLARGSMLPLAAATGVFAAAASGAIQEIANFVSKANPSTYFQFNRALDDLAGTLGQTLTPVLEGVTVFVRTFADAMQGLRPSLEPIMLSMKAIIIEMSRLIDPLSMLMQPALELLGTVMKNIVVPAVTDLVDILTTLAKTIKETVETISFGLVKLDFERKSSVGAAVRPAAYSKGVEDIGKRTTLAALNQSDKNDTGKKIDTTNGLLSKILEKIGVEKDTRGWIDRNKGRVAAGVATLGVSEIIRGIRDL